MHNFSFGIESLLPAWYMPGLFDYSHRNLSQVGLYSSSLTLTLKKYLSRPITYFYGKYLSDLTPKMHWTWLLKSYCTSVNLCYTASIHSSAPICIQYILCRAIYI
jgi:hypothetical protein